MGKVIDLRNRHSKGPAATRGGGVTCAQCDERHPIVRLADGSERCVTAFAVGQWWFCRNRGCHAAWRAGHPEIGS